MVLLVAAPVLAQATATKAGATATGDAIVSALSGPGWYADYPLLKPTDRLSIRVRVDGRERTITDEAGKLRVRYRANIKTHTSEGGKPGTLLKNGCAITIWRWGRKVLVERGQTATLFYRPVDEKIAAHRERHGDEIEWHVTTGMLREEKAQAEIELAKLRAENQSLKVELETALARTEFLRARNATLEDRILGAPRRSVESVATARMRSAATAAAR
jgi:hypothetical protein